LADSVAVEGAVDVGELVAGFVAIFVDDFGCNQVGINAKKDEVGTAVKHLVGGHEELGGGGAVDEAFGLEAGGGVGLGNGRFPFNLGGNV
jgi:hypothetical protein